MVTSFCAACFFVAMAATMAVASPVVASSMGAIRIGALVPVASVMTSIMTATMTSMAVAVLLFSIKEAVIHLVKNFVQGECFDAQDEIHVNARILGASDLCGSVDHANLCLHLVHIPRCHKVRFVEQKAIGECYLLYRLIDNAIWLLLLKMLHDVLAIDHSQDAIEDHVGLHKIISEEGLSNWCRVCQACCLDDDAIERFSLSSSLFVQLFKPGD
mmetsp:Transcript_56652/g.112654  ORF Transcript_56652/g.112654 Transcript_56652/m.112654 type:complete len:215 (+) Transcript_56652:382-1026(+)